MMLRSANLFVVPAAAKSTGTQPPNQDARDTTPCPCRSKTGSTPAAPCIAPKSLIRRGGDTWASTPRKRPEDTQARLVDPPIDFTNATTIDAATLARSSSRVRRLASPARARPPARIRTRSHSYSASDNVFSSRRVHDRRTLSCKGVRCGPADPAGCASDPETAGPQWTQRVHCGEMSATYPTSRIAWIISSSAAPS